MSATCAICQKRSAKRRCPGTRVGTVLTGVPAVVVGEICAACCGRERENTIDCPLECVYLRDARQRETHGVADPEKIPNREIDVSESFLREHEREFLGLGQALANVMIAERSVDSEAAEALEVLIQSYRASESGLIYEARIRNPAAIKIRDALKAAVEKLAEQVRKETGIHSQKGSAALKDSVVLKVLVFLQRLVLQHGNGRRRGRSFFEFMLAVFAVPEASSTATAEPDPAQE